MQLPRCRPAIVSALQRCITRGSAIQITVLAFPFKVPNPAKVGARKLPDFAELAAIHQCLKLRTAIQRIYPPGLEYHILHDGPLMANVFDVEMDEVRAYEAYFSKLVEMLAPDCVCCHDFGELQLRSLLDPSGSIEELRFNAERWFQENRGTAEMDNCLSQDAWNDQLARIAGRAGCRSPAARDDRPTSFGVGAHRAPGVHGDGAIPRGRCHHSSV